MIYLFNKKTIQKNISGFTLMEVLVAVSLFAIIILGATKIYLKIADNQETISQENYVQSDIEYFLKIFSNNAKEAQFSSGSCSVSAGKFYSLENSSSTINFIVNNYCYSFEYLSVDGNGGIYFLNSVIASPKIITSSETNILDLKFVVDDSISERQPIVTVLVKAAPKSDPEDIMYVQDSFSLNTEY